MKPFFIDYMDRLGDLHEDCKVVLSGLSEDALDWKPGPGMNSISVLIVHIVGADRYWYGDFIRKEPSGRKRDQEFLSSGLDSSTLSQRLDDAFTYIEKSLEPMSLQEMDEIRISPRDGQEFTIGWAMLHILKHTALHLGHMEVARQMWEMRVENT